jgi:hypothetical protein
MGERGLWMGIAAGAALQLAVQVFLLSRWDWGKEAARVQRRMAEAAARGLPPPELAGAH